MTTLLFALLLSLGCADTSAIACPDDDGGGYAAGETWEPDACNTCSCQEDGHVVCTLVGCESVTCTDENGQVRAVGESWDAEDGCNTCSCEEDGSASCTELGCL